MLRFFSRRKPKGRRDQRMPDHKPLGPSPAKKHILPCRIILLDGADLSIDISVRRNNSLHRILKYTAGLGRFACVEINGFPPLQNHFCFRRKNKSVL